MDPLFWLCELQLQALPTPYSAVGTLLWLFRGTLGWGTAWIRETWPHGLFLHSVVSALTHFRDGSGANSVHNKLLAGPWCEKQGALCGEGSLLRSSSVYSCSELAPSSCSISLLWRLLVSWSALPFLPWLHVSMCLHSHLLALCCSCWTNQGEALGQCELVQCEHFSEITNWGAGPWSGFKAAEFPQLSLNCFLLSLVSVPSKRFITLEISQVDANRKWSFQ